jgi:hypothetical protein
MTHHVATSNESEIHPKPGLHYVGPFIDKLSLTLSFPPDKREQIETNLKEAFKYTGTFQKAHSNSLYFCSKRIALQETPEMVFLSAFPRTSAIADCRFDLNPSKLGWAGIGSLDHRLLSIFEGGWDFVTDHARVSRIDVAINLVGTNPEQFLPITNGGTWSSHWRRDGRLESLYQGRPGSNQWVIYNKSAEQKAKGFLLAQETVRIERRLRNPKISLKGLKELSNPFKKLVLAEMVPLAPAGEDPDHWAMFGDSIAQRGVENALALVKPNKRAKYKQYLKDQNWASWKPDEIWSKWPVALADLK